MELERPALLALQRRRAVEDEAERALEDARVARAFRLARPEHRVPCEIRRVFRGGGGSQRRRGPEACDMWPRNIHVAAATLRLR